MTRAMAQEIDAIGLSPVDSQWGIPLRSEVEADSGLSLFVVVAGDRTGVVGPTYVALAGPDSLCALEPRGISYGIRIGIGAAQEWNVGLTHLAPWLRVAGPVEARRLAAAELTYATGHVWDAVWVSADTASEGWNVHGMLTTRGGSRWFFVREGLDGRLETLVLQAPPDPPAAPR